MNEIRVEAEVPESRQLTLTLPLEVPVGRVQIVLSPVGEAPAIKYLRPTDPAEANEFDSFVQLVPELRRTHGGHFVAVRAGRVIASGLYLDPVTKLAKAAVGTESFYCGWIEPLAGYIFRMGSPGAFAEATTQ